MGAQILAAKREAAFENARRVNQALTAKMEKRALQWMAERAPMWVTSDQLTVLGLTAQIGAGICFGLSRYDRRFLLAVIVCLAVNWLGDSLDGTLARVRRQERPRYGFYVDHIVDVLGSVALMEKVGETTGKRNSSKTADVMLRYNFPGSGLSDDALRTLILMVLDKGAEIRHALTG